MKFYERIPALLLLEDGTLFTGKAAGKIGTASGEICFNTGMTGYQEIFTDPSYYGQILVTTNVHIGIYGTHLEEVESDSVKIASLVCRNFSVHYSRKVAVASVEEYFIEQNLVAIADVDTRALVRHIRDKGAMNAVVSSEITEVEKLREILSAVPSMAGLELSSKVTTKKPYITGDKNANYKVALLDLGVKKNIIRSLVERGCMVQVFPMNTSYKEMKAWEPDGFLLSNGPGDPAALTGVVETVKQILADNNPLFGICLGQQVLALACGIPTYKMFNGHRGINHPVKNLLTGKCEITSQNHGFSVSEDAIKKNKNVEVTHINLNDNTIEGFRVKDKIAFSVQYHPEACPGPHDSRYLFDQFVASMKRVEVSA
ncbi:MAG TPA: glutamine-hydrolyzing carbamoyl-phosphate synthase small subunit [Bacteroidia bacterium]|nr:glutamine-hydrolyzing carbamoyl-phosphate synthase small subunit [Bacteroidia bacterium]